MSSMLHLSIVYIFKKMTLKIPLPFSIPIGVSCIVDSSTLCSRYVPHVEAIDRVNVLSPLDSPFHTTQSGTHTENSKLMHSSISEGRIYQKSMYNSLNLDQGEYGRKHGFHHVKDYQRF